MAMTDPQAKTQKGLIKTFLTGAALPVVWIGCLRRPKPKWLTEELCYTGKAARDLSFVFGIVCGVSGILKIESCLMNHFLLSEPSVATTPQIPSRSPPKATAIPMPQPFLPFGGSVVEEGEYRIEKVPYIIPQDDPSSPEAKLVI